MSPAPARWRLTSNRRGFAVIAGGTALGQAILVVSSPILSRIYSPAAFGLFATFTSIASILGVVAAARLEMAVPIVADEVEARRVVESALGLTFLVGAVGAVAGALIGPWVTVLNGLGDWLWLVPPAAAAAAAFLVLNQWAVRKASFGAIGRRNTIRALVTVVVQVAAGLAGLRMGGIIIGVVAGNVVGAFVMLGGSGVSARAFVTGISHLGSVLSDYQSLCIKLSIAGFFNIAGTQFPVVLFATWFDREQVGWLGLTQRTLTLPIGLVGTAAAQVYLSVLSDAARGGRDIAPLFRRASRTLGAVGLLGAGVLAASGPWLFRSVFGAPWEEAGEYARLLSVGAAMQLVAVPLSQTLIVAGRTTLQLTWDVGRFVFVCAAMAIVHLVTGKASDVVAVLGASLALSYVIQWWLCARTVREWRPMPLSRNQSTIDDP